ncbi:MAG: hypothetical protein ACMG6E_09990 [Candidatus Roizmanbacteria bacterium]
MDEGGTPLDVQGSSLCKATGFLNLYTEFLSYFYIASLSYLMKKMVTSPTSNFYIITKIQHIATISIATLIVVLGYFYLEYGLSVRLLTGTILTMAIEYSCLRHHHGSHQSVHLDI